LFDSHSYEKGGLVLYMLSNFIGEEKFKEAIKKYLDTYRESVATTGEFQKICEDVFKEDLQQFSNNGYIQRVIPNLKYNFL